MSLKRKILIRIYLLTFAIILAMSVTYYILFTNDVRKRSHQQVIMTFRLIADDLRSRVNTVLPQITQFTDSALVSPMYMLSMLQQQGASSVQENAVWNMTKTMTYLSGIALEMQSFGSLVDAREILIYDHNRQLLAASTEHEDELLTLVYLPDVDSGVFAPIREGDLWYAMLQSFDEIPRLPLPDHISLYDESPVPDTTTVSTTLLNNYVTLTIHFPIQEQNSLLGTCIVHLDIRQHDVERYARLSGTEVNVFAGSALSVGTLKAHNYLAPGSQQSQPDVRWLTAETNLPAIDFSRNRIRGTSYYQGMLLLSTPDVATGAITVNLPRQLEEQEIARFLLIVVGITVGFSVLVAGEAIGLSGAIVRPIVQLMSVMQNVESGDFDVEAPAKSHDEIGKLGRTFNTMTSRLKQSFQHIEHQNLELQRMDKLKDEFLANTSHELRTPLNGIAGLAEAILSGADGPLTAEERQHVRLILQSSIRLANLVSGLLDFSKAKSGQIQLHIAPFPLEEVTEVVCAFSRELLRDKPVELRVDLPGDLPEIYADIDRVEQILTNLVGNAIKFTKEGTITISAERQNDWLCIAVADTGIGIPDEALERIFNPFEQADGSITREFGGTGLGLSVTKELVELHGGHVWVQSEKGIGSTFFVTLPCTEQAAADAIRSRAAGPTDVEGFAAADVHTSLQSNKVLFTTPPPERDVPVSLPEQGYEISGQGYTVLIIDDDLTNLEVLRTQLNQAGFRVLTASNGQEAFDVINGYDVDVILCDVMMPVVDGYTFAMHMRERENLKDIPLVFVSAKGQKQDVMKGYNAGAVEYLIKPVARDELLAKVHALVEMRQRTRSRYVPEDAIRTVDRLYDVEQEKEDQFTAIQHGNAETILVVDDEPINIEVLKAQLGRHNYQVVTASNGPDALDKIAEQRPHLVILDLMMPKMSGFRVCQILRHEMRLRNLPVILLTAKSNIYDKVYGLNIGANDYVIKPFYLDELLTRIHVLLNIASLQRELLATNESLRAEIIERTQAEEALQTEVAEHRKTAEELWEVNEKLAHLNNELEHKVEERTLELQASVDSLKATQQHLVQSEKMAALGGLVAGIAHEMNTPIGVCITASSLLQEKTEDLQSWLQTSQLTRTMLNNYLELAANSSAMLVRNLQQTATLIQNFKQAAVEKDELVGRVFELKEQVEHSLLPLYYDELHNSPHRVCVSGDEAVVMESFPGAITQVVTSLVMNSLIHAFPEGHAGEIRLDISSQDDQALLIYSDNGHGIPATHQQHIFDPFFTTTRSTGGTGLGLHIVYNLVTHKLKGTITCQSKEGTGTTFIITLPLKLPGAKPRAS